MQKLIGRRNFLIPVCFYWIAWMQIIQIDQCSLSTKFVKLIYTILWILLKRFGDVLYSIKWNADVWEFEHSHVANSSVLKTKPGPINLGTTSRRTERIDLTTVHKIRTRIWKLMLWEQNFNAILALNFKSKQWNGYLQEARKLYLIMQSFFLI